MQGKAGKDPKDGAERSNGEKEVFMCGIGWEMSILTYPIRKCLLFNHK